jgi:hypothetical protein
VAGELAADFHAACDAACAVGGLGHNQFHLAIVEQQHRALVYHIHDITVRELHARGRAGAGIRVEHKHLALRKRHWLSENTHTDLGALSPCELVAQVHKQKHVVHTKCFYFAF